MTDEKVLNIMRKAEAKVYKPGEKFDQDMALKVMSCDILAEGLKEITEMIKKRTEEILTRTN